MSNRTHPPRKRDVVFDTAREAGEALLFTTITIPAFAVCITAIFAVRRVRIWVTGKDEPSPFPWLQPQPFR